MRNQCWEFDVDRSVLYAEETNAIIGLSSFMSGLTMPALLVSGFAP